MHWISAGAAALTLVVTAAGCAQTGAGDAAEKFPNGDVTVLVPFAPGSSTDVVARVWAQCYEKELGVPFVVENREGGSGSIGMTQAARADADGYTIVQGSTSSGVLTPYFQEDLAYDVESFTPIGAVALTPSFVVVAKDSPLRTMDDLIEAGKRETLSVSDSGAVTSGGIVSEALAKNYGIRVEHVVPSSLAETKRGLEQGDLDYAVVPASRETTPWLTDGGLRGLGIVADESPSWAPDLPTLKELGYGDDQLPGPGILGYWAVPAETPSEIVGILEEANATCLEDSTVRETLGEVILPPEVYDSEDVRGWLGEAATALTGLGLR